MEIPKAERNRYLVFEEKNGSFSLIDDFVAPSAPEIMQVRQENGILVYSTRSGQRVLTRPVKSADKQ